MITVSSRCIASINFYGELMPVSANEPIHGASHPFYMLALVQPALRSILEHLKATLDLRLVFCITVEEFVRLSKEAQYSVVLLPADNLASHHWCSLWGVASLLNPKPSILVYTLERDSRIWASVLAAGGFDVVTAPFTEEKVLLALQAAEEDFHRQLIL
jgi:hypothetical protein